MNPNQRQRNILLLVLLVAVAAFLYASAIMKFAYRGF